MPLCLYCRKEPISVEHVLSCLMVQLTRILMLPAFLCSVLVLRFSTHVHVCARVWVCVRVCVCVRARVGARVRV